MRSNEILEVLFGIDALPRDVIGADERQRKRRGGAQPLRLRWVSVDRRARSRHNSAHMDGVERHDKHLL